ncbi:MAG TPA: hypothetical protein VL128_11390 [Candidatus Eisenbacteria bacterium]|nr:hypothetical protein [Candidatus Eisenbacteria bacterium]
MPALGWSLARAISLEAAFLGASLINAQTPPQKVTPKTPATPTVPQTGEQIPSPISRHFPILIIAHGTEFHWSMRLGMKGPERLDRDGYPPIVLDPGAVLPGDSDDSWTYPAKDDDAGADVTVHVSRVACSDDMSGTKYTFTVVVQHAQIGTLNGCGQSEPEKFPEFRKKNQLDIPDDTDDKNADKGKNSDKDKDKDDKAKNRSSVLDPITKFHSPVDVAYLDAAGRVIFGRGSVRKNVAPAGSELAVSHDGRKLLFTRSASGNRPERSIVLYDSATGTLRELVGPNAHSAFWSSDDSQVAFLKYDGQQWQVWTLPTADPSQAKMLSPQPVESLHGWISPNTVLVSDMQSLWWLSEDKPPQSIALKDVYGDTFQVMSSDTIRPNPINPDLLLVSAYYLHAPAGAPVDSVGLNSTFFLYELRSHRRVVLGPPDTFARAAEWSRDGLQIFFTRVVPGRNAIGTSRIFWDASGLRNYSAGSYFVIGK